MWNLDRAAAHEFADYGIAGEGEPGIVALVDALKHGGDFSRVPGLVHRRDGNIVVNPSGEYVDVPWRDTEDLGYAVQACNIHNRELGSFSELEYHVPAIGSETGRRFCEDVSQVWAFRGGREEIECVVRSLLTTEL